MSRPIADWLYRYRWWPWLVTLLIAPAYLWPASFWLDVKAVDIESARYGAPLHMTVERTIQRPFRGSWNITIRQWDGGGWVTWCNATGRSNYSQHAKLPKDLALQWWTDGQCHPLAEGRYKITTSWKIETPAWVPDKEIAIDSNAFEVTP